jgi:glycosyltransferase involved in cell wall biosynthesis
MKVVFATYDAPTDVGGVSTWLRRLLPQLQAGGWAVEVHLLCQGNQPGANCRWYAAHGIPFRWAPWPVHSATAVRRLCDLLALADPDIYVPNCLVPAYFAAGFAREYGVRTVGVLHSDDAFYWGIAEEFLGRRPQFRLDAMVGVSGFLAAAIRQAAAPGIEVRLIGCGVPIPEAFAAPPQDSFRLVYLGRLDETQKRIRLVAKALVSVVTQIPGTEAWIVGEGPERPAVELIIAPSKDRVRLLGAIENERVYEILRQCHAFVLLSEYEGLPVSLLEAMSTGVVPICLDMRSGIRDVIANGENGFIVQDRDADFLNAVRRLQQEPGTWRRMSQAARFYVAARHSIEDCTDQWLELLRVLASGRPDRRPFQAPSRIVLPPQNPKFGWFDGRPPGFANRCLSRCRSHLKGWRSKLLRS